MIKIFKIIGNSTLLIILLSMIALPTGFMGIMSYEENPAVLSAQDDRERVEGGLINSISDPDARVPEDIEEVILRMEREYYNPDQEYFVGDIERTEEIEQPTLPEELTEQPETLE